MARDALWRGPVTVPQATADWLLGTPVGPAPAAAAEVPAVRGGRRAAGAAVGIVPAAALVALGLGGRDAASVLRLTGAAMLPRRCSSRPGPGWPASSNGIRDLALGAPGHPGRPGRRSRAGRAGRLGALGHAPSVVTTVVLWSGPWGWAAQPWSP